MMLALPPPGSHGFFAALLSIVKDTVLGQVAVDPVILQSVLLCLVTGGKNLILRVPEDDVNTVLKVVTLTLSTIFGLHVNRVRLRSTASDHPNAFLKNLFLRTSYSTGHEDTLSSRRKSVVKHGRRHHRANSAKSPLSAVSYTRSWSDPDGIPKAPLPPPHLQLATEAPEDWQRRTSGMTIDPHSASPLTTNTLNLPPSDSATEIGALSSKSILSHHKRPSHRQTNTDPLPLPHLDASANLLNGTYDVPQALVLSGLESIGQRSQRALLNVLTERKVVLDHEEEYTSEDEEGVWNLPEGFILIYVCPLDQRERPQIHKTLLDKFALSTTVNLHPSARLSMRTSSYSQTINPAMAQEPGKSPISARMSLPPGAASEAILSPSFISELKAAFQRVKISPPLELYMSDLLSAVRHHPQLDGTFLTLRAQQDAHEMIRAARVLGGDLTGTELISGIAHLDPSMELDGPPVLEEEEEKFGVPPPTGLGGDEYAEAYEDVMQDENLRCSFARSRESSHLQGDGVASLGSSVDDLFVGESWLDVSEADVARMLPRIVSHRLRVRDGPEDEVLGSALYGTVQESTTTFERTTVKEVLVKILAEV